MDFADFVKELYNAEYDSNQRAALQRLDRIMNRTPSIESLVSTNDSNLDPFEPVRIARLADAHREYNEWKESAKNLRRSLAQENLAIPDGSIHMAFTPHEISALARTAQMCKRSGYSDHSDWAAAVNTHVEFWRNCVSLSLAHGSAVIELADADHGSAQQYASLVSSRVILLELSASDWIRIQKGESLDILRVTLELPWKEIKRHTESRLPQFGLLAVKHGADAVLDELVNNDLESAVRYILTRRAEQEVLEAARSAYMDLLATPPLQQDPPLILYTNASDAPVGLVVLDRKGDILAHSLLNTDADLQDELKNAVDRFQPQALIIPDNPVAESRLGQFAPLLGSVDVHRILDTAITEAATSLSLEPIEAAAVVLGRRALKPGREWSRLDPLVLDLPEYPKEIDPERLVRILNEAKILSSWKRRKKKTRQGSRSKVARAQGKRLNPSIKTIRDLRPGMTVDGIITNITRFGAFVNIGLPVEGMIHVSQLSMEFVEDPSQAVKVGQQVNARILEVVPEKERIALSLKPAPTDMPRDRTAPANSEMSARTKRTPPKTRAAALADLDALFKK